MNRRPVGGGWRTLIGMHGSRAASAPAGSRSGGERFITGAESRTGAWQQSSSSDRFSRNRHGNTPLAFSRDAMALVRAQETVSAGVLDCPVARRGRFSAQTLHAQRIPAHSSDRTGIVRGVRAPETLDYERRHKAIVERLGRYAHRNAILDRPSTDAERTFLEQPGSSFQGVPRHGFTAGLPFGPATVPVRRMKHRRRRRRSGGRVPAR